MDDRRLHRPRRPAPGTGDELDHLASTLNGLLDRLDGAMTRERRFVADASHELRTPVAGARALLETETTDPAAVRRTRAEALVALGQLQDLVDDLLVLARADEAGAPAPGTPVDLDELVLGPGPPAPAGRRTCDIDVTRVSGGQVVGHDTDLGRLVENLAANAVRHASTGVAFTVQTGDGMVELTVEDDGPGIAEADRSRVFERFTTLDDARAAGRRGTGLGLSIAAAIVAAHGGSIVADGTAGRGARFVVRLPAAEGTLSRPAPRPRLSRALMPPWGTRGRGVGSRSSSSACCSWARARATTATRTPAGPRSPRRRPPPPVTRSRASRRSTRVTRAGRSSATTWPTAA